MKTEELLKILKTAVDLEPELKDGRIIGCGCINSCPECADMSLSDYHNKHYPKMKKLLESLPWKQIVADPRNPQPGEYPSESGDYLTMIDANEHEVVCNRFTKGNGYGQDRWTLYNRTHIKWWMPWPDDIHQILTEKQRSCNNDKQERV